MLLLPTPVPLLTLSPVLGMAFPFPPYGKLILIFLFPVQALAAVTFFCLHAPLPMLLLGLGYELFLWIPTASCVSLSFILITEYAIIPRSTCSQDLGVGNPRKQGRCLSGSIISASRRHTRSVSCFFPSVPTVPVYVQLCPACTFPPLKNFRILLSKLTTQFHIRDIISS